MPVTCSLHDLMPVVVGALHRVTSGLVLRWMLFVAIFSLAAVPPLDPDLWWHLANGRLIVATGSIPHLDLSSSSAAGHPWVMHEWPSGSRMYRPCPVAAPPLLPPTCAGGGACRPT